MYMIIIDMLYNNYYHGPRACQMSCSWNSPDKLVIQRVYTPSHTIYAALAGVWVPPLLTGGL